MRPAAGSPAVSARRLSREERKAETRTALLDAAGKVFARRGYHAAAVDEVAEEAGFSTGALYSNFDGKEDLFLALLQREIGRQVDAVAAVVADRETLAERARGGAEYWIEFLDREPELVLLFMEFWAFAVRNPEVRSRFAARYAEVRSSLARIIDQGARELGVELARPPEQLAMAIDALADGFALQKLADPDSVPDELFGDALAMLLEGARRR
ncbi:MAG: TetR/AcrR family transcriptional regulator [Thermoleophilaceae bacterium]|nr:TetR/AcrR family transcriptional regulator [Thermoleophilaceae bacterium]